MPKTPFKSHKPGEEPKCKKCPPFEEAVAFYIVDAVKKAANEFPLTKAEYFGSYAEGYANDESDVDMLVEFDEPSVSILTITIDEVHI